MVPRLIPKHDIEVIRVFFPILLLHPSFFEPIDDRLDAGLLLFFYENFFFFLMGRDNLLDLVLKLDDRLCDP